MKRTNSFTTIIFICILTSLASLSMSIFAGNATAFTLKDHLASIDRIAGKSKQVLLVTDDKFLFFFTRIKVYALEKSGDKWQLSLEPMPAVIGKKYFAAAGEKREGDGKTPSGIFPLKNTFGYNEAVPTKMDYRQALSDDLWVDDPNATDYNRWVKKENTQALSYEKMKRDDDLYKYGIVIEYNTNPVVKNSGSAIFFHVWGGAGNTTAGCVAVSEENIIKILSWLDPQALPLIIMGTEESIERFTP